MNFLFLYSNGGRLRIIGDGNRTEMPWLERSPHETLPLGPEEGQSFYYKRQRAKGFNP